MECTLCRYMCFIGIIENENFICRNCCNKKYQSINDVEKLITKNIPHILGNTEEEYKIIIDKTKRENTRLLCQRIVNKRYSK